MGQPTATITMQPPTLRRGSRSASAAWRIGATDRGGGQHVVRTGGGSGQAAVVDRRMKRLGPISCVEGNASLRPRQRQVEATEARESRDPTR
jgi:hypothetical protein